MNKFCVHTLLLVLITLSVVSAINTPARANPELSGNLFIAVNVWHATQRSTAAFGCFTCSYGYFVNLDNQTRSDQLRFPSCPWSPMTILGGVRIPGKNQLLIYSRITGSTGSWIALDTKTYQTSCVSNSFPHLLQTFAYASDLNIIFASTSGAYETPTYLLSIDPATFKSTVFATLSGGQVRILSLVYDQKNKIIYAVEGYYGTPPFYFHTIDVQTRQVTSYNFNTNEKINSFIMINPFIDPTTQNLMAVCQIYDTNSAIQIYVGSITLDNVAHNALVTPVGPYNPTSARGSPGSVFFSGPNNTTGYLLDAPHLLKFNTASNPQAIDILSWPAFQFEDGATVGGTIYVSNS